MESERITGICMGNIYTHDYDKAYDFYVVTLGLGDAHQMGEMACYLKISPDAGIYIEGGYRKQEMLTKSSRVSFSLEVTSCAAIFSKLKNAGITIVHEAPVKMDENIYWFQCYDPVGNLIEFLGGQ